MKLKLTNFRVIKKIGHGGMGVVYVAEDLALGRLVALKVLAPYLVQDPEILERFRFEARNQAQLVHTNITMVYSFLVEDEQAFLVLEFIDGETLESRINREGRIVAMEALPIFRKILGALGYAHSKGMIHRDIKPGNIAFTSEGDVKIMDFGIALNIEATGRLTKTGHILGTPHYMAPEQILGEELTFRTDIYALGITLFEMLTGRLPFDSKSDFEIRVAQIKHPPPSPRSFGYQDITPELEEVILKALAKEPEARFSSAREFLQALEAAVGRDHLVTRVKGTHLDKSTQILEANREPVPPPSELHREEEEPSALPSWEQQRAEPAAMPVAEQPLISPDMQTGWFSRPRLIFLTLSLLPLIALLILFRAYFLTGPSTSKTMVSPQAKATASEKVVPPANHREEKAPVSVVPPATQPVSPVSKEPVSAELGKKAQDQPDKEKSATIAALPPPEKKVEIPEIKEPKSVDLQKTIKDSLAANGFPNMRVLVDEKKRVFISGQVKNMVQQNKVISIVNSMGLSMPADYSNLKVMKEVVAETVKKRRPEAPSTPHQILEASPKPAPPEVPRKPLPPRLDRGNIQF